MRPLFVHRESISTSASAGAKRQGSTSTSVAEDGEGGLLRASPVASRVACIVAVSKEDVRWYRVVLASIESRDEIQVTLMDMQTAGYREAERRQQRIKPTWSVHGEGSSR
ncbi:hypothetical protein CGRA01v4_02815 [Colletotrichum graminicola]|uniref:Tudor domain-containing protein n=1 Tax=Colletotrichum graminicola (strain M1.001 / M2 / FGSC 10212) TaxID=645133 RepID=E3QA83_COLGM|nr:uncharacterized protein GLRG_02915 [Colletotrichum graminicola M1.001]EFQ27771.1 hypothetical protein GLRG_02915 [Colletotrichum graminicola M1.001]WDK11535.1 hypothetical protein CGRA01v4_02815 [Colletotrichum graminicola]